jgi:hypothetical protein
MNQPIDSGPSSAPQTDPTNPYHEEASGIWTRAEEVSVWKVDEPGLTDRDRKERSVTAPMQP